jgi:hypothetical protein
MKNKDLIKNWKTLAIKFKTSGQVRNMTDMFLLCWGETDMDIDGKKEKAVVFDEGGMQGAPALFCQSDDQKNCIALGWDERKNTSVKSIIGKFVKAKISKKELPKKK